jgi:hypothetical protein
MAIPRATLMVELLMSADRIITAAQAAPLPADPAAWSPPTVVGHLAIVDEQVWLPRLQVMASARLDGPPAFTWWEPDPVATQAEFAQSSVDDAAARLLAARTSLLHSLRGLDDRGWASIATHDAFGLLDVEGLMLQVLGHDEEHRASLVLPS